MFILGVINLGAIVITLLKVATPEFRKENRLFFVFTILLAVQACINFLSISWHLVGGIN